jgi:hypothetical protein
MNTSTRTRPPIQHAAVAATIMAILLATAACGTEQASTREADGPARSSSADTAWQARVQHTDAMLAEKGHDTDTPRLAPGQRLPDYMNRPSVRAALDRTATLG